MLSRLRRLFVRKPKRPEHPALDAWEHQLDVNLARASHRTVEDIQRDSRRRALTIERDSMRRES